MTTAARAAAVDGEAVRGDRGEEGEKGEEEELREVHSAVGVAEVRNRDISKGRKRLLNKLCDRLTQESLLRLCNGRKTEWKGTGRAESFKVRI